MDSIKFALILITGLFISVVFVSSNRFYDILPKPFICKVLDSHIVHNYTCITKVINRTYHYNSREIIFQNGVEITNYYIVIQISRKVGSVFRHLMEVEQDMCDFCKGNSSRDSSILAKVLNIDGRRKFGNMFDPCPLMERRYEKEAVIDYSKMPEVVPPGEYLVDILGYTMINGKKNKFMLTQWSSEVISKLKRKG